MRVYRKDRCKWYAGIVVLVLAAFAWSGVARSSVRPRKKAKERVVVGRVTVQESRAGVSVVVKMASTLKKDGFSKDEIVNHLKVTPPLTLSVTPRPDGFLLSGPFETGRQYTLRILKGLKSRKGAALVREVSVPVKIPQPSPHVSFLLKGRYIGRNGDMKLPVRVMNGQKILLTVRHVPDRSLPIWEKSFGWEKRDLEEIDLKDEPVVLSAVGKGIFLLDLASYLSPDKGGLYRVELRACRGEVKKRKCSKDEMFLVVTNMGLIVKATKKRIYAWVVDLTTGQPVPGVTVKGYSVKNILMGQGVTRDDGACSFPVNRAAAGTPFVVTAVHGKDYTYLPLDNTRVRTTFFRVGGMDRDRISFLTAFVLERNLYRPGETLKYAVVLRDPRTFQGVSVPVVVKFRDPKGRVLLTQRAMTDSLGLADFTLPIPREALTGTYGLELTMGGRIIRTEVVRVEDFVPERTKVTVRPTSNLFTDPRKAAFEIRARYLFGAPVAKGPFQARFRLERMKKGFYKDYRFGPVRLPGEEVKALPSIRRSGVLDGEGKALIRLDGGFPSEKEAPMNLKVSVEVKEAGSERVSRGESTVPFRLAPRYPGLRLVSHVPCQTARIDGILVDAMGQPLTSDTELRYTLYQVETHYVLTYSSRGRRRWGRTVVRLPLSGDLPLKVRQGKFHIPIEIKKCWADYLVAVRDPEGGAVSELLIPGWASGGSRPPTPEILKITLNRKEAAPGETIEATTVLPFPGHVLWTLELNDVISSQWRVEKDRKATFSFKAPADAATLYVTAYLYQTRPGYLVTRAFGVSRMRVVPPKTKAAVRLEAPEKIRPGDTFNVRIDGPAGGKALVAVVDEGILQIAHTPLPDLYNLLLKPYRLAVDTYEGLGWILPKFRFLPGGGEMMAKMAAVGPVPRFFRTFSFWKVVNLSPQGKATVPVTVEKYQGALKVMVSVLGMSEFGSTHATTRVVSRVVVQPTLPRLVRRNDTVTFPVSLVNTESKEMETTVRVVSGKARVEKTATLPSKGTQTLFFALHPTLFYGLLPVDISAAFPQGGWKDTYRLRVLPDLPRDLATRLIEAEKGKAVSLGSYLKGWAPEGLNVKVLVSSTPLFGGLRHVERLLRYPYGCVEQTSSTLLTLVRLLPFMKYLNAGEGDLSKLRDRVRSGILRLVKMQMYSGGFPFWPGGREPHRWGSAYATFALLEAKEAGFYVPPVVLRRAVQYLADEERSPWSDFVLVKSGKYRYEAPRRRKKGKPGKEELLLQAGTLYYSGYPMRAERVLAKAKKAGIVKKRRRETFFSPLRVGALQLYMTFLITPKSGDNARLARDLMTRLNRYPTWRYTTQELAWSLVALGRYLQSLSLRPVQATLLSGETPLPVVSATSGILAWDLKGDATRALSLTVKDPGKVWVSLTIDGYRTQGFKPVKDKGLVVTHRLLKADGSPATAVKAGDLLLLDVGLLNTRKETYRRMAVRIPMVAGLEVVNERLFGRQLPRIGKGHGFKPRYIDIRDAEARLFGDLPPGESHYFLQVRATFRYRGEMPPPRAELMYRPWIYGIGEPMTLQVK